MRISIITVCKNPGDSLKKTVESVISQSYDNIEYIVVDGASTDGTAEWLKEMIGTDSKGKKFFAPTRYLKYVSEPDSGIYNAMNKGIDLATGDVLYFLNAGDMFYCDTTVDFFMNKFSDEQDVDVVYGNVILKYPDGRFVEKKFDKVGRYFLFHETINHQTVFFRSKIFNKTGLFKEEYKICSDYEKIMNIFNEGCCLKYVNKQVCTYMMDGISSDPENYDIYKNEHRIISCNYFKLWEVLLFSNCFYRKGRIFLRKLGFDIYG